MKIGHKVPPHGCNGKPTGGTPIMRIHHKDGVSTDRTGKPVYSVHQLFICRYESQQQLNAKFIVNISVAADSSLLSPTGCVNRISPDTAIHEQMAT